MHTHVKIAFIDTLEDNLKYNTKFKLRAFEMLLFGAQPEY